MRQFSLEVQNQKFENLNGKFYINISLNKFKHICLFFVFTMKFKMADDTISEWTWQPQSKSKQCGETCCDSARSPLYIYFDFFL